MRSAASPGSTPPLTEIQGFLVEAFQRSESVIDDRALAEACAAHVSGNDRLTPAEQVDIYRRQFWLRHIDSLIEDYPGLRYVLGEDGFEAFCRGYLAAHPPHVPSLRDLGADLVAFAERYEGFAPDRRDLARDMARYEHAFVDVFDGAEPPPLDPDKLRALPEQAWETARIVLSPLLARITARYPVHAIRFAVKSSETPDLSVHGVGRADPTEEGEAREAQGPYHIGLYRKDCVIHYEVLSAEAFQLLDALARGVPLVPACAALAADRDAEAAAELEARVGAWFQQWAAWGWIIDVRMP
jgi:Putative DNA-binding domain